jgi:hypothetical protein
MSRTAATSKSRPAQRKRTPTRSARPTPTRRGSKPSTRRVTVLAHDIDIVGGPTSVGSEIVAGHVRIVTNSEKLARQIRGLYQATDRAVYDLLAPSDEGEFPAWNDGPIPRTTERKWGDGGEG